MAMTVRNLVEYHGTGDCRLESVDHFKQINIDFTFLVPCQKPSIEQLLKVWVKPKILQNKIVKTPKGESLEGQRVTGYKCMLSGDLIYKIEYVALETSQSLHTAHMVMPFCGYIVLPENFNTNNVLHVSAHIEDIYSEVIDERNVYNNVTMMLVADLC